MCELPDLKQYLEAGKSTVGGGERRLRKIEKPDTWVEVTRERYWKMLEVLPPYLETPSKNPCKIKGRRFIHPGAQRPWQLIPERPRVSHSVISASSATYACRPNDISPLCNVRVPLKTDSRSRWG